MWQTDPKLKFSNGYNHMVVAGSYVGSGTEIDNSGNQNQQVWLANLPDMYHVKQILKSDNSGSRNFHQNPPYKTKLTESDTS